MKGLWLILLSVAWVYAQEPAESNRAERSPIQPRVNSSVVHLSNTSFMPMDETSMQFGIVQRGYLGLAINRYIEDSDLDGVADNYDLCPGTPEGERVNQNGCPIFNLPPESFELTTTSNPCIGQSDGLITLRALNRDYHYQVEFNGSGSRIALDETNNYYLEFDGLASGVYTLCVFLLERPNFRQCFELVIEEPEKFTVDTATLNQGQSLEINLQGEGSHTIKLNETVVITDKKRVVLDLQKGANTLEVRGEFECQGIYTEEIFVSEKVMIYPNPTSGPVELYITGRDLVVQVSLRGLAGQLIKSELLSVGPSRVIQYHIGNQPTGVYLLEIEGETVRKQLKVIKQ